MMLQKLKKNPTHPEPVEPIEHIVIHESSIKKMN